MGIEILPHHAMDNSVGRWREDLHIVLGAVVPGNHSRQTSAEKFAEDATRALPRPLRVMDLGCGDGNSIDLFRGLDTGAHWTGLDIMDSPEVARRTRKDGDFRIFDGVEMPFENDSFDIVFSKQVFEHVRHPAPLLTEVRRVLRQGGFFIGSTSHLEAYHSFSFWNYTPYGFLRLLADAGLAPLELRPGIDALTLIMYRALRRPRFFARWWSTESPLNRCIGTFGRLRGMEHDRINATKLLFCGQFCFNAKKI